MVIDAETISSVLLFLFPERILTSPICAYMCVYICVCILKYVTQHEHLMAPDTVYSPYTKAVTAGDSLI